GGRGGAGGRSCPGAASAAAGLPALLEAPLRFAPRGAEPARSPRAVMPSASPPSSTAPAGRGLVLVQFPSALFGRPIGYLRQRTAELLRLAELAGDGLISWA